MLVLRFDHLSHERVWALLDNATEGVWFWDIQGDVVRWSAGLFSHLGYSASEAAALDDVVAMTHPDDVATQEAAIRTTVEEGAPYDIRIRLRRADETYSWVDGRGVMEGDDEGEPAFMLGYVIDVTAEQSALEALRLSEGRFRSFMENSPVAVFLRDAQGVHRYANRKAAEIAGTGLESIVGRRVAELFPEEVASELEAMDAEVAAIREVRERTLSVERPDGTRLWIHSVAFPVEVEGGETAVGAFGVDLTELRATQLRADAADRPRSLGRMAGGIAHDFNSMLSVILGFTELVREDLPEGSENRRQLAEVTEAAERSSQLTRQLLGFARQQTIQPETLDLGRYAEEFSRLLRSIVGENIWLELDSAEGTPPVSLDRAQVDQILTNLCVNARDAIHGVGTVTIRVCTPGNPVGEMSLLSDVPASATAVVAEASRYWLKSRDRLEELRTGPRRSRRPSRPRSPGVSAARSSPGTRADGEGPVNRSGGAQPSPSSASRRSASTRLIGVSTMSSVSSSTRR